MSHTNTTTNYGLPQFLSSDKPAWMADINVAFADIDSQMKTNANAASAAQSTADDAVLNGAPGYSNLSTYAVGDVVNYLGRVYKCDIAVTTPEAFDNAKWSYYNLSDASAQIDVIDGQIGSADISGIGDGTLTGAINAVNAGLSDLGVGSVPVTNNTRMSSYGGVAALIDGSLAKGLVPWIEAVNINTNYKVIMKFVDYNPGTRARFASIQTGQSNTFAIFDGSTPSFNFRRLDNATDDFQTLSDYDIKLYYR